MTPELQLDSSAWSEANSKATLKKLRLDYPGYSVNELYAIWCHANRKTPVDRDGKLLLEQWQIHATVDGQHIQDGGFKVSHALFGRAKKAERGMAKPPRAPRTTKSSRTPPTSDSTKAFSPEAVEFAQAYDRAVALLPSLLEQRRAFQDILKQLRECPAGILALLVEHHEGIDWILVPDECPTD